MRRMRVWTPAAVGALMVLAGCDAPSTPAAPTGEPVAVKPAAPAASAFSSTVSADQSGYYLPASEVVVGPYRLDHLFLGQGFEFEAWEGGERSRTFAPVMLQFDDVSSPMVATELGEQRSVTARVLPTSYAVTEGAVRFEGESSELGAVRFEGRLDQGALATARRNLGEEAPVLTGTLRIGGRTFAGVRFRWYGGD